jgi:hypothetical protein
MQPLLNAAHSHIHIQQPSPLNSHASPTISTPSETPQDGHSTIVNTISSSQSAVAMKGSQQASSAAAPVAPQPAPRPPRPPMPKAVSMIEETEVAHKSGRQSELHEGTLQQEVAAITSAARPPAPPRPTGPPSHSHHIGSKPSPSPQLSLSRSDSANLRTSPTSPIPVKSPGVTPRRPAAPPSSVIHSRSSVPATTASLTCEPKHPRLVEIVPTITNGRRVSLRGDQAAATLSSYSWYHGLISREVRFTRCHSLDEMISVFVLYVLKCFNQLIPLFDQPLRASIDVKRLYRCSWQSSVSAPTLLRGTF